ncbi:HEAT repeat domain-containing protein [Halarchaeum sp. P4]|uniref:HEAT repeat domain-containing protein n=1 Tax=Halarchaeum sp. P4 TaxID=3421639 RepID=UPI003EBA974D
MGIPDPNPDGPADPQLDPERSPGFESSISALEDIEVSRDDVVIGTAEPHELTAADTDPVAGNAPDELLADLREGTATERQRAALELADRERTPAAVEALATAARDDADADVRQFAVEALGELGGDRAAAVARDATDDDDPWVRAEAIVALDHLDRAAHADHLDAALGDPHHAVRRNALVSLFKLRGEGALPALLDAVDDDSERVREWVAHLLGGIDDERASDALETLARDDVGVVAKTAVDALDTDAGRFRRQFTKAAERTTNAPADDRLNRHPDL